MKNKSNAKSFAILSAQLKKERERGKKLIAQIDSLSSDEALYELVKGNEAVKNRIIAEYLAALAAKKSPTLIFSGETALTPVHKPKNLMDAKRLAERIIKY